MQSVEFTNKEEIEMASQDDDSDFGALDARVNGWCFNDEIMGKSYVGQKFIPE